jgi:hypothetical protein
LGPLLFLIYINDITQNIPEEVSIKLYADDLKLYKSHNNKGITTMKLGEALVNIHSWSVKWGIDINFEKSFVFYIGKNNPKKKYTIGNNVIKETSCVKDLGILIDNQLKFSNHISKIIKNAYFSIRCILKNFKSRSISIYRRLYTAYIRPQIEYAPEIWSPHLVKDFARIEKIQRFFTRMVLRKCMLPDLPYKARLKFLGLETLENRRKIFDLSMMYKILTGRTHLNPYSLFTPSERIGRKHNKQVKIKHRISKTAHSFVNRTSNLWNRLDQTAVNSKTVEEFKIRVQIWLKQQDTEKD